MVALRLVAFLGLLVAVHARGVKDKFLQEQRQDQEEISEEGRSGASGSSGASGASGAFDMGASGESGESGLGASGASGMDLMDADVPKPGAPPPMLGEGDSGAAAIPDPLDMAKKPKKKAKEARDQGEEGATGAPAEAPKGDEDDEGPSGESSVPKARRFFKAPLQGSGTRKPGLLRRGKKEEVPSGESGTSEKGTAPETDEDEKIVDENGKEIKKAAPKDDENEDEKVAKGAQGQGEEAKTAPKRKWKAPLWSSGMRSPKMVARGQLAAAVKGNVIEVSKAGKEQQEEKGEPNETETKFTKKPEEVKEEKPKIVPDILEDNAQIKSQAKA